MSSHIVFHLCTAVVMIGTGTLSLALIGAVGLASSPSLSYVTRTAWYDSFFRGYAILLLACWYVFESGHSIAEALIPVFAVSLIVLALRRKILFASVRLHPRSLLLVLFEMAIIYFFLPGIRPGWLPVAIQGNNDIFNYANLTSIALAHSPKLADTFVGTNLVQAVHGDVFGAFVWLAIPSLLHGHPPIESTMPALVMACAMLGLLLFELFRRSFRLSPTVSVILALYTLTNGVFLFVSFYYFLSQVLAFIAFFGLVLTTLNLFEVGKASLINIIVRSFPYYLAMLMVYPILLLPHMLMQLVLIYILLSNQRWHSRKLFAKSLASVTALFPITTISLLYLLMPSRFISSIAFVTSSAAVRRGTSLISLPMVFGAPRVYGVSHGALWINIITLLLAIVCAAMVARKLIRYREEGDAVISAMAILAVWVLSLLLYAGVASWYGPSYQEWKFATYYPLMLNAILPAAALVLMRRAGSNRCYVSVAIACLAIVLLNFAHANQRVWHGFSSGFRSIQAIDQLKKVHTVLIDKLPFGEVMLVRQYIHKKMLRPSSPSYYPFQPIPPQEVGPASPVLSRDACFGSVPHALALSGGFFLAPSLPSLSIGEVFKFGEFDCHWQLESDGISGSEGAGRWTDKEHVKLSIHLSSVPSGAVSLRLRAAPFLVPGKLTQQRVELKVNGHLIATHIFTKSGPADWVILLPTGTISSKRLILDLLLPDSRSPAAVAPPSTDQRRLGLFLESLSLQNPGPMMSKKITEANQAHD